MMEMCSKEILLDLGFMEIERLIWPDFYTKIKAINPELASRIGEANRNVSIAYRIGEIEGLRSAFDNLKKLIKRGAILLLDNFDNYFSEEEIKHIAKRVLESQDKAQGFHQFFQRLRKNSELYNLIMFHQAKLIDFDAGGSFAIIKDQEGKEVRITL